jgi:outer membrane protein OmpA-like peptidoglycan-associated protein
MFLKSTSKYVCLILFLFGGKSVQGQSSKVIDDHFKALKQHDVKAIASGYSDSAKAF